MNVQLRKKEPTDVTSSKKQFRKVESMKVTDFSFMLMNLETETRVKSPVPQDLPAGQTSGFSVGTSRGPLLPIVDKKAVFVYLVLQGEVEGEIFDPFVVVDLHLRGVLIGLEVLDDIREPDRQAVIPGAQRCQEMRSYRAPEI